MRVALSQTLLQSVLFSFLVLYCFHGRRNPFEGHNGGLVVEWDCQKAVFHMNSIKAGTSEIDYMAMGMQICRSNNQCIKSTSTHDSWFCAKEQH